MCARIYGTVFDDVGFLAGQVKFDGELYTRGGGENVIGSASQKLRQSSGVSDEQNLPPDSYTDVHELASTRDGQSRGGLLEGEMEEP